MAEQAVSPQATVVVTGAAPLAHHHGEASPSSSPQGSSFVKAIDRKARSYLKTLERSFSFSMPDTRAEDPSSMTIEFLRARLQAQRAEYKAEKQRAQQLAKKVLELEQRLNFEIEQRNKAERNDMLTSPCYRSTTPNCKGSQSSMEREGLVLINSKFKENSLGEEDYSDWCSEISGSEGHLEGDGVVLISPSSLQRHWKSLRLEHQHRGNQHGSYVANEINAESVMDKESITLNHKESREKPCEAAYCVDPLEGPEGLVDLDSMNSQVMTKFMQDSTSETLSASPAIDSRSLRIANTFDIRASRQKGPSETGHIVFQAYPPRQASFTSESSQHQMNATKATSCHSNNYIARPIDNCKNRQQTFSRSPISPCDKVVATNLTPQRGKNLQESQASLKAANANIPASDTSKGTTNTHPLFKSLSIGNDRILEYLVGHSSHKIQEMQDEGPSLRQETRHEDESKYMKAILSPHFPSTIQIQEIIRSSEKPLHAPYNNGSFSAVQARHRWKLHGRRLSLDGGLDWLQEAGKAVEDVQAAEFKNYVLNHYY